jgi:hypothetical protein
VAALALSISCARKAPVAVAGSLQIAQAENLRPEAAFGWVAQGVPALLEVAFQGAGVAVQRGGEGVSGAALRCRLEGTSARLRLACWREGESAQYQAEGPLAQGVAALAAAVAQQIVPKATASTVPDGALEAFAGGNWESAVQLAPDFWPAYADGAEAARAAGDPDRSRRLIDAALARPVPEAYRVRLNYIQASIQGDRPAQLDALRKLNLLATHDAARLREQASLELAQREFQRAAETQARIVSLMPGQAALLNQLLYLQGYAGDLDGARKTAAAYAAALPNHPDPMDSLGEVLFHNRQYASAARQFAETHEKYPATFGGGEALKSAVAFLYAGDRAAAEQQWKLWMSAGGARAAEWNQALWLYYSGERGRADQAGAAAVERMSAGESMVPLAHLSVWALLRGDPARASARARQSLAAAQSAASPAAGAFKLQAALAYFLAQPPAAAPEWASRAERMFPGPGAQALRQTLAGFALMAAGRAADAEPFARAALAASNPQAEFQARALLNWCLASQNKPEAKLIASAPFPPVLPGGVLEVALIVQDIQLRRQ